MKTGIDRDLPLSRRGAVKSSVHYPRKEIQAKANNFLQRLILHKETKDWSEWEDEWKDLCNISKGVLKLGYILKFK